MIVDQFGSRVDVLLGEKEYAAVRIRRVYHNPDQSFTSEKVCSIFQDAKGNLTIEYKGKRVVDEREGGEQ